MRLRIDGNDGFSAWLSARDTYDWVHRSGHSWPCSTLSNKRCFVSFDGNGLVDVAINGRRGVDIPGDELNAIVADLVCSKLPDDHQWKTL